MMAVGFEMLQNSKHGVGNSIDLRQERLGNDHYTQLLIHDRRLSYFSGLK
jgi:hypothetical protein